MNETVERLVLSTITVNKLTRMKCKKKKKRRQNEHHDMLLKGTSVGVKCVRAITLCHRTRFLYSNYSLGVKRGWSLISIFK